MTMQPNALTDRARPLAPDSRNWSDCAHCGELVPQGSAPGREPVFCCAGCEAVHHAICDAGLDAFYLGRFEGDAKRPPVRPTGARYTELDGSGTLERTNTDGTRSAELHIEGIHCAGCVWLLENLPRVAAGVREARLDFGRSLLAVRWDPERTALSEIARSIDALGYVPHAKKPTFASRNGVERALLMRLGVAGAIAGNVMLMALALYSGAASDTATEYASMFRWGSLLLSVPAVGYCAAVFYRGAWAAIRTRTPNMDVPIALGISVGFASGAVNTLKGQGEIYFDTITVLIFLLLVGRWLTARQHRRAATAADFAQSLAPATARLVEAGERRQVRAENVPSGALVEVLPKERISVDGRIERGESTIDSRLLTGESNANDAKVGDRVYAGTENLTALIQIRVEHSGQATRVGQLIAAMEAAQRERAPIVRAADRIAGYFVSAVLLLAAVTLSIWWSTDPSLAIDHAVALLVVTCPCALGMATPLAVSVALSRAAGRGILLKNGEVLEALARPTDMLFDKSGTLTLGRPELVHWDGTPELGKRVSVAERGCDHPLARALQRAFPAEDLPWADWARRANGAGVMASVNGVELVVGTPAFLTANGVDVPESRAEAALGSAASGLTPVLVAEDGQVRALAAFGDALRPDAAPSLRALHELGYSSHVLSGDHALVVERICRALPVVSFRGEMSPEQKLEEVLTRRRQGQSVVVVGDGMNDAAAMSAATVGFAVHGGAEASLLAASGFATQEGVAPVLEAVRGARETLRVIHRGVAFSLGYNLLGVALAMGGLLNPLLAAVLMPLSSLTVVASALRSRAFLVPSDSGGR